MTDALVALIILSLAFVAVARPVGIAVSTSRKCVTTATRSLVVRREALETDWTSP